jgi:hypothetical protein
MVPRSEIVANTSDMEVVFRVTLFTLTFSTDSTLSLTGAPPLTQTKRALLISASILERVARADRK